MKAAAIARGLALVVATSTVGVACSTSSSSAPVLDITDACRALANACHRYDTGSGPAHDCHILGHESTDDVCAPKKAKCLEICPPMDAAPDTRLLDEDGAAEIPVDAGPEVDAGDPCAVYCDCMAASCSMQSGYPYATPDACIAACRQFDADENQCWPNWCAEAAQGSPIKDHLCEHAWGKFGLDECAP